MHLLLTLLLAATGGVTTPAAHWLWPVEPPRVIARPYLAPATPYAAGHRGIDIETALTRAEVFAPADGVVHFAGLVVDRLVISIRHAGGVLSSFEPVFPLVHEGDEVTRGQLIGTLELGHCEVVACLHFGVRLGGEYVSPLLFLGGLERSVLLPSRTPSAGTALGTGAAQRPEMASAPSGARALSPRRTPPRARGRP